MADEEHPGTDPKRDSPQKRRRPRRIRSMDFGQADEAPETVDVQSMHAPIMREKSEPRDGYEPIPLWLVGLFGVLLFWGGWYIGQYSGGFRADVLDPEPAARFAQVGAAEPEEVNPLVLGEKLYKSSCVSCHQASGQGVPGQYPPLVDSRWVDGPPHRLKRILLHGLEGPVTVRGETYDGNMPAFGKQLDDEKIAAVLTYIRQSWGNQASAIPAESVAATRSATADRTEPWSADELEAITDPDYTEPEEVAATQPADEATPTTETGPSP
jgi:mono/diheme cytochrome c family protein